MRVFVASDHAGKKIKDHVCFFLKKSNKSFEDLSPVNNFDDDYPDFAKKVAKSVIERKGKGVLVCGTGIGMSIAANKFKGIRAALCSSPKEAELSRMHNNANVLVLSGSLSKVVASKIISKFLSTRFGGGRHTRRIKKIE